MTRCSLRKGDCLGLLRSVASESVDAIVTDPPYGLRFMGKRWDYDVPSVEVWAECLRVLKPGGHLLAFAGTRTQHRIAVRIEDAGFEIRDMIAWVYGSGFPKSLDVSKAIDKAAGRIGQSVVAIKREIRRRYESQGMTLAEFNSACGFEASGYLRESSTWASVLPPASKWQVIKAVLDCGDELDLLFAEAEREVVAQQRGTALAVAPGQNSRRDSISLEITAPATPEAQQWAGWGTALKPALEPITVARKPLIGTVAANVLAHGTGALNVDACRVPHAGEKDLAEHDKMVKAIKARGGKLGNSWKNSSDLSGANDVNRSGRWPANLVHDGGEEVLSLFPDTGKSTGGRTVKRSGGGDVGSGKKSEKSWTNDDPGYGDSGSAARFFYSAKASKRERGDSKHPTIKPVALMRYLVRLVTPPGGLVLDPFMGTGTTGVAALAEGFRFVGFEREAEYFEAAVRRTAGKE